MKLFQFITSSRFQNLSRFSLKTVIKVPPHKLYATRKFSFSYLASSHLNHSKFHTTCWAGKPTEGLNILSAKKRFQKKKSPKWKDDLKGQALSAVAYSSAEGYKMQDLLKGLENQGEYENLPLPEDIRDDLHVCMKSDSTELPSHIYIFSEGSLVFWNVPELKQKEMLNFLKSYEINSYDDDLIEAEKEDLDYTYSEDETRMRDGCIILNSNVNTDLHSYTFSNSLANSVKLGILERAFENYSDSIEWVTEKMKKSEKIKMSRSEIFAKRGELFSLRHAINLSSDLLDTPDFYWDRKDLEILYQKTCNYLDIPLRIRTMNVRLNYCSELVDLLGNHLNDEHHVRLEWMIIILIMVEVVFECIHFLERFAH